MKSTDVEKLNQIVSRTDKSGNEKVVLLIKFANEYHERQLKILNIPFVTKRYVVVYVEGNHRNMKTIEFDATGDRDALGQFCLKIPTGRWIQVREKT